MEVEHARKPLKTRPARSHTSGSRMPAYLGVPFALAGAIVLALTVRFPAVLRDEFRAPLWLAGVVGSFLFIVGASLVVFTWRASARKRRARRKAVELPGRPWEWDHAWNRAGCSDTEWRLLVRSICTTIVTAMFLTPFNYWAFFTSASNAFVKVMAGLFDLVLVVMLLAIGLQLVRGLKYGMSSIRFSNFPFRLGDRVTVQLNTPRGLDQCSELTYTVRCVEEKFETRQHTERENGRRRKVQSQTTALYQLYAETGTLENHGSEAGGAIPIELRIDLPRDDALATRLSEVPPTYWELELRGDAPGLDYYATFLLPVYR